jgi:CheY-like chemotaxis protein
VSEAVRELILQQYDYLLTDLHIETKAGFETPDGLTVIRAAVEQQPSITIVATSSDPRTEVVNAALAAGAITLSESPYQSPTKLRSRSSWPSSGAAWQRAVVLKTRPAIGKLTRKNMLTALSRESVS